MKKFLLVVLCLLQFVAYCETLNGGIYEEYIPEGFFGSWAVISKLNHTDNFQMFNSESRDIWTLSGYSNILFLENLESGAKSKITVEHKNLDNKTLKFSRKKVINKTNKKTIIREIISFTLDGNKFRGEDNYIVEKYSKDNKLLEKNQANYTISGVKISGSTPN